MEPSESTVLTSLNHLPPEILHCIFQHLDIPDILRIRMVSRYLDGISRSRDVWSDLCRKAEFIRPPGPFPFQSAIDLESALIPSFRTDRNLRQGGSTTQTERRTRKLREFRCTDIDRGASLVFGRFLLIAFSEEVQCYDLDLHDSNASVIYRSTGATLRSFHCVSCIDTEGKNIACVVLNEEMRTTNLISIYSLNAGDSSEVTLERLYQYEQRALDILTVHLGPRIIIIGDRASRDVVALDVHTRALFLLPSFRRLKSEAAKIKMELNSIEMYFMYTTISTSTHLVLALSFENGTEWQTFFQAFAVPPSDTHHRFISGSVSSHLCPSHRGIISGALMNGAILLRDSILDPATQDVLIAILILPSGSSSCSPGGVLRLSAIHTSPDHDSEIGTITFQPLNSSPPSGFFRLGVPFLYPMFNGVSRAFYTQLPGSDVLSAIEYNLDAIGDADAEQEIKITEYPCVLRFPTPRKILDYDPYSGRICLRIVPASRSVFEILDFAA